MPLDEKRKGPRNSCDMKRKRCLPRQNFIKISQKNRKIHRKTRMKNEISFSFQQKFGRFFAEILKCKRCKSLFILQSLKNAVKCDFARYRSYPYSRERALQNLGVISFIFHSSPQSSSRWEGYDFPSLERMHEPRRVERQTIPQRTGTIH